MKRAKSLLSIGMRGSSVVMWQSYHMTLDYSTISSSSTSAKVAGGA